MSIISVRGRKCFLKRILQDPDNEHFNFIVGWYGFKLQNLSDDEWTEARVEPKRSDKYYRKHSNYVNHRFPNLSQEERAPLIEAEVLEQLDIARARKVILLKRRFKRGRTSPARDRC